MESIWKNLKGRPRTLFVAAAILLTVLCVFLVVLRLWPGVAIIAFVTVLIIICDHIYRHFQDTPPDPMDQRILPTLVGAFVGTVLGLAYLVYYANSDAVLFIPVEAVAVSGGIIGLVCPRLVIGLVGLVIRIFSWF